MRCCGIQIACRALVVSLAVLFTDHERHGDDINLGVNLLADVGVDTASGLFPCLQGKTVITEDSSLAVVLGLRF